MDPEVTELYQQLYHYENIVNSIKQLIHTRLQTLQTNCPHQNTERIVEYDQVRTLCKDCNLYY